MLSISLGFVEAFSITSQLINDLFPVYLVPFGITLGLGILALLVKAVSSLTNKVGTIDRAFYFCGDRSIVDKTNSRPSA